MKLDRVESSMKEIILTMNDVAPEYPMTKPERQQWSQYSL